MNSWEQFNATASRNMGMVPPLHPPNLPDMNFFNKGPVDDDTQMTDEFSTMLADQDKNHKSRRDRDRDRKHSSNERYNKNDRSKYDRNGKSDRSRRDRPSKWSNDTPQNFAAAHGVEQPMMGNVMMPSNVASYNMGNMMAQAPNEMGNMSNMGNMMGQAPNVMGNMSNMGMVQGNMGGMMPGMNMMGGMMDPNMMMMMSNMPVAQGFYVTGGAVLPPLPNYQHPKRRERPNGCRTIFIGGLPEGTHESNVMEIFARFGTIVQIQIDQDFMCNVRYENQESVEQAFAVSGYRIKLNHQTENEATALFVDYALNRIDQNEYELQRRRRSPTPPPVEPCTQTSLSAVGEKIKSETEFGEVAQTVVTWLERGECNKRNATLFYALVQASNQQTRRLFNEKIVLDEQYNQVKNTYKEKYSKVVTQFEQVEKILTAAKHQRVSDHFTKQQRRNIEMWLRMTEDVANLKEEFNAAFNEDETDRPGQDTVSLTKYEALQAETTNLMYELEGYKNEAAATKQEAEMQFEKFKAQYIAQLALQSGKPMPSPVVKFEEQKTSNIPVSPSEAKLISILTAFLLVHPLGASLDYLVSYVRSMTPNVTQAMVSDVLRKYTDVFRKKTSGVGASIEHKWQFVTFASIANGQ